jgi:yjeF C-terminal region, hydroxyethylthiazole kinase-related/yjeF N-terminal region
MQYIADAREAKEIDGVSIQKIGIPSFVLMERAALKVAEYVSRIMGKDEGRILVACGCGNNGGDGVAAGRILKEWGYEVVIALLGKEEKASEDMKQQLTIARKLSVPVITEPVIAEYTVIIDAIFGIGLSREVTGSYAGWIAEINHADAITLAVDIPSGIDASTGKVLGTAVRADYTVTFGVNKRGLLLYPGTQYAGEVFVEDIGFPEKAVHDVTPAVISYDRSDIERLFPKRQPRSHKGNYGRTLVIAGSKQISGAAYLAAAAACRIGSGLVKVFTHENNRIMLQTKLPEALLCTYQGNERLPADYMDDIFESGRDALPFLEEDSEKEESVEFVRRLKNELSWATAVVIGPGLGTSRMAELLLYRVLKITDIPVLMDADALNLLPRFPEYFNQDGRIQLTDNFVLTPHLKEMSRLLGNDVEEIKNNLIDTACRYTKGAAVVLKDARTVVSDGTRIYLNQSGNNALAKGGSGDVLSGMIGGLLSGGMEPFQAASLGVYLHGLTADEYVRDRSRSTMLASDILEELPKILP